MTSWPSHPPVPPRDPWYRNAWVWIGVYGGVVLIGLVAAAVAFFVLIDSSYPEDDSYYYVDQESVNSAAAEPCRDMQIAGNDIAVFVPADEGAAALRRFVDSSRPLPAAIGAVPGADAAARQWRDDWTSLLDALDSHADELEDDPTAEFVTPQNRDGDPVLLSLSYASDVECELPPAIVALDPEAADPF